MMFHSYSNSEHVLNMFFTIAAQIWLVIGNTWGAFGWALRNLCFSQSYQVFAVTVLCPLHK